MPNNNIRLFTARELVDFEDQYTFDYDEETNEILVMVSSIDRTTRHIATEPFSIHSKVRKVTFTPEAISMWLRLRKQRRSYTLLKVQQAINMCKILYQPVTDALVIQFMTDSNVKIQRTGVY